MPQAVDNIALVLEQLSEQVRSLERRVAALETGLVILSGASASRSEALAESKDPIPACTRMNVSRHSHRTAAVDE